METLKLFAPFENANFDENTCFLTGEDISDSNDSLTVFPKWVMEKYGYKEQSFKMMDNVTSIKYKDLKLPCSQTVKTAFNELDKVIENAFTNGYSGVNSLSEQQLFLWMSRMVYGVLYHDLLLEKKKKAEGEFSVSPRLKERFGLFHLMLQSIISPISFGELKPWSIAIVKLKYSKDIFNYRDDTINLIFTLGMNGFGIVASLQDNGAVLNEHQTLLKKIGNSELHPVQFEELCARFIYSKYLLQYKPQYKVEHNESTMFIESLPITVTDNRPIFAKWDDNMFAQVLAEYWKPWGLTKKEIIQFPNAPISYLENECTYDFVEPESISLPF